MKTYTTISEAKADNKSINHHWFDRSSMRFFKTKIESGIIKGVYFISSEINPSDKKMFSVRMVLNGQIETIGNFHSFRTKQDAMNFIKELPDQFPHAYELAVNEFNGKTKKGEFVKHASIEPENSQTKSFSMDTFCGACTWLILNYELVGHSFISYFADQCEWV